MTIEYCTSFECFFNVKKQKIYLFTKIDFDAFAFSPTLSQPNFSSLQLSNFFHFMHFLCFYCLYILRSSSVQIALFKQLMVMNDLGFLVASTLSIVSFLSLFMKRRWKRHLVRFWLIMYQKGKRESGAAANKIVCPTMCPPDVWGRSCDGEIDVQSPAYMKVKAVDPMRNFL